MRKRIIALVAGLAVLIGVSPASASTGTSVSTSGLSVVFPPFDSQKGGWYWKTVLNSSEGAGMEDAGFLNGGKTDAFDGYGDFRCANGYRTSNATVSGATLSNTIPDFSSNAAYSGARSVGSTLYGLGTSDGVSALGDTGDVVIEYDPVTGDPSKVLKVNVEWFFFGDAPLARQVVSLTNLTGSEVTASCDRRGDVGSQSNTTQHSSGPPSGTNAPDTWVVTSDNNFVGDPVLTHVYAEAGAPVPGVVIAELGENYEVEPGFSVKDRFLHRYDFTLAAGETRYLVFFVEMRDYVTASFSDAVAASITGASSYSSLTPRLLTGFAGDQAMIMNWVVSGGGGDEESDRGRDSSDRDDEGSDEQPPIADLAQPALAQTGTDSALWMLGSLAGGSVILAGVMLLLHSRRRYVTN